jgi:hypothetical protein
MQTDARTRVGALFFAVAQLVFRFGLHYLYTSSTVRKSGFGAPCVVIILVVFCIAFSSTCRMCILFCSCHIFILSCSLMVALTHVFSILRHSNVPFRSAFALVNVVFTQRSVFYMQKRGQYFRPSLFPISFLLSDLPLTALNTLIYSLITYSMIGFVNGVGSANFGYFLLMGLIMSTAGRAWAFFLASALPVEAVLFELFVFRVLRTSHAQHLCVLLDM